MTSRPPPKSDSDQLTTATGPASTTASEGNPTVNTAQTTAVDREDAPTVDGVEARIRQQADAVGKARVRKDPFIGRDILGRFRIDSKIGEGGMGAVYRGLQTSVDRPVAIKILLRNLVAQEKFVRRFKNEALAVSKLAHPNTVRIYEFGQVDDTTLFIAMEFLDGTPLQRVARKEGAMAVRRVLHILKQTCEALFEAHSKGIVHRDLKPDNLFLCEVGNDRDFVKVLDFGVAKFKEPGSEGEALTQTHMILGTPRYMAPEQARGRDVDHRSDLYALGVIGYELLLGKAPFSGDAMTVLYKQVHEPPPPMEDRAPDVLIPLAVERLIMALLSKDPELRPANARALAELLGGYLNDLPADYNRVVRRGDVTASIENAVVDHLDERSDLFSPTALAEGPAVRPPSVWGLRIALLVALVALGGLGVWAATRPGDQVVVVETSEVRGRALLPLNLSQPLADYVAVKVVSKPPGAELFHDGRSLGRAPLTLERRRDSEAVLQVQFPEGKPEYVVAMFNEPNTVLAEQSKGLTTPPPPKPEVKQPTPEAKPPATATSEGKQKPPSTKKPYTRPKTRPATGKSDTSGKLDIAKPPETKVKPPGGRVSPLK